MTLGNQLAPSSGLTAFGRLGSTLVGPWSLLGACVWSLGLGSWEKLSLRPSGCGKRPWSSVLSRVLR